MARAAKLRQTKKPGARIGSGRCPQTKPGKDAGLRRERPDSGKRRNPERVSAPGTARKRSPERTPDLGASGRTRAKEETRCAYRLRALPPNKARKGRRT
ncbi:MAG: hypothetical protein DBX40_02830 [Clostridiales bacterium]|nr:MAG: hypothetical protein DBX40_02830 [Clostridiales bacterium]